MKAPIVYMEKEAANVFKPIWSAAKFIGKNPYARRVAVGAGIGAGVGGTANMMAGDVGSQGKNFAKGALIGAGVGALAGGAVAGRKAWGAHKAIVNTTNSVKQLSMAPKLKNIGSYTPKVRAPKIVAPSGEMAAMKPPKIKFSMAKTSSFWKATKGVGKVVLPLGIVGGSLLYWNNRTKPENKSPYGKVYKTVAPMRRYGE